MNHGPAHDLNLLVLEEKEIDGKVIDTKGRVLYLVLRTRTRPRLRLRSVILIS